MSDSSLNDKRNEDKESRGPHVLREIIEPPFSPSPFVLWTRSLLMGIVEKFRRGGQWEDRFITVQQLCYLCCTVKTIFQMEETIINIDSKKRIIIIGDLLGRFDDLLNLWARIGPPSRDTTQVYLGNFVDLGPKSIEVICTLFAYKILFPQNIYLLRGCHETPDMNGFYGFKLQLDRWNLCGDSEENFRLINNTFNFMPLAIIINNSIFCSDSGITPYFEDKWKIMGLSRPIHMSNKEVEAMLWSKPSETEDTWIREGRGYIYGISQVKRFLEKSELSFMIRSNDIVPEGYNFYENKVLTISSIPNFYKFPKFTYNKGAIVIIDNHILRILVYNKYFDLQKTERIRIAEETSSLVTPTAENLNNA